MECPECNWNQIYLEIIINSIITIFIAMSIAILFKFVIVPKIEKKYERNALNALEGVMGFLNSFDQNFKFFYESFEHHMGNIRNLNHGEWLPSPYQKATTNETGGMVFLLKPESSRISNIMMEFDLLNKDLFKKEEEMLRGAAKTMYEYMAKNEIYLDPLLKRHIEQYMTWTIFYVEWLRKHQNYSQQLFKRLERAKTIIRLLKKEESFSDKFTRFRKGKKFEDVPHIGQFVKKWQDYIDSEK